MDAKTPALTRQTNFVLQQGLSAPSPESCPLTYSGLLFQPRLVGLIVVAGTMTAFMRTASQAAAIFIALAVLLLWSGAFPRWNVFDIVYNRFLSPKSGFRLQPAPAPRRFAQTLAGALSIVIAVLLILDHAVAALIVDAVLLAAIAALVLGGFCFGSYVFHVLSGRGGFANRTLPWSRPTDQR
jgi:tellurite resistance protein TehA-like permease